MEKIYFENSNGVKLCGLLSEPVRLTETAKINDFRVQETTVSCTDAYKLTPVSVIVCHGFGSSKNGSTPPALQEIFDRNAITTLRFDFFGHGESGGNFSEITISEAVDDILNAIKFLKKRGYDKIGLAGSSFGGISSTIAASKSEDLFALALKSPVSDYYELERLRMGDKGIDVWKRKGYVDYENGMKLKYSFFEDFKNNNAYEAAKRIKIPTIVVHGDADDVVPVEQSVKLSKIIKKCRLEIIRGGDHNFSDNNDFNKAVVIISEFMVNEASKP